MPRDKFWQVLLRGCFADQQMRQSLLIRSYILGWNSWEISNLRYNIDKHLTGPLLMMLLWLLLLLLLLLVLERAASRGPGHRVTVFKMNHFDLIFDRAVDRLLLAFLRSLYPGNLHMTIEMISDCL